MAKAGRLLKYAAIAAIVILAAAKTALFLTAPKVKDLPPLKNGDLVFQSTADLQSMAVVLASDSLYTHMGMIKTTGRYPVVVEAVGPVEETPLQRWIDRGLEKRVAIYRIRGLKPKDAGKAFAWARKHYGKPYDFFFLPGDDAFYCSELIHDAYGKGAGLSVGRVQKVGELTPSSFMDDVIRDRWQAYPPCQGKPGMTLEKCRDIIMKQELVTPASIAHDPKSDPVYSNYLFDNK